MLIASAPVTGAAGTLASRMLRARCVKEEGDKLNVGRRGDLLACDEAEWSRVDFIVAGPPCPPFSSIGPKRPPEADPREAIFRKVTKIIISQGRRRCLGFIVEMVPGIAHRPRERAAPMSHKREATSTIGWRTCATRRRLKCCRPVLLLSLLCAHVYAHAHVEAISHIEC